MVFQLSSQQHPCPRSKAARKLFHQASTCLSSLRNRELASRTQVSIFSPSLTRSIVALTLGVFSSPRSLPSRESTRRNFPPRRQAQSGNISYLKLAGGCSHASRRRLITVGRKDIGHLRTEDGRCTTVWLYRWLRTASCMD